MAISKVKMNGTTYTIGEPEMDYNNLERFALYSISNGITEYTVPNDGVIQWIETDFYTPFGSSTYIFSSLELAKVSNGISLNIGSANWNVEVAMTKLNTTIPKDLVVKKGDVIKILNFTTLGTSATAQYNYTSKQFPCNMIFIPFK